MNIKLINGLKHHYISDTGNVYSNISGQLTELKQYIDSRKLYMMITISECGKRHKYLVHRLVADAFIPNPNHYPEVNHKDYNHKNNNYSNLEWCTRKYNNNHMFITKTNVRNFRRCTLLKNGITIKQCNSINDACRTASELFNASYSVLNKYRKSGDIEIIINETSNDYPVGE